MDHKFYTYILVFLFEWVYAKSLLSNAIEYTNKESCVLGQNGNKVQERVTRKLMAYNRRRNKLPQPGPPRGPEYDPTWGYEPYWVKGDWVFEEKPTKTGDACGQACAPQYVEYGEICGIKRDKKYNLEHKTFNNYCEMQNEDCTTLSQVWLIAYRGACRSTLQTYPTKATLLQDRALQYITAYFSRNPPTIRLTTKTTRHPQPG